ncbi:RNA polymerase sigma factor [Paenibacillus sp. FSL R10-2734]|uniref:RNA polymerase sigma factor n=1 Tax=Paenibacillus sp. FSL R10-2734 TaxID=2954691 RepID=UPI0030DD4D8C
MIILEKLIAGHEPDENNTKSLQMALKRYCLALTHSPWEAEDLAQDTWVKVLGYMQNSKQINQMNNTNQMNHPNPEALLLRIARNTWIDMMRRKTTLSRLLEMDQSRVEEAAGHGSFEIEAAFQALREHLSPLQQAVFLLRDVFGHSGMEAAEILGTTEGAVKAALHRARQALPAVRQELLQADGPALSQDTELQITLGRLSVAYEQGQIAELIELVLADEEQEAVMAVSSQSFQSFQSFQSVQSLQCGGFSSTGWSFAEPGMRMAA